MMINRRTALKALGILSAGTIVSPLDLFSTLSDRNLAYAQTANKTNFILVRSLFDFRDDNRTNFGADLAPLVTWQNDLSLVQGLSANGDGSEYHNGKQIRFATSSTPQDRNGRNNGGGTYDGKSVDVVIGEHQKTVTNSRNPYLVLGAYAYSVAGLQSTFETVTFANKNQYVRPEYDMTPIQSQIATFAQPCDSTAPEVDTAALEQENLVIEQVMRDLERSSEFRRAEVRAQTEALKVQFDSRRAENVTLINGAPMCTNVRTTPLPYAYTRPAIASQAFDAQLRNVNHTAALALTTNYTNVVTLNYNFSGHGQPGVPGFHDHTHPGGFARAPSNQELANLDQISQFQVHMFAHLMRELADFGILENTVIIYSPHERPTHDHNDVPVIAYGMPKKGAFRSGARIQDVWRDVLETMSVPNANNFGGERSAGGVLV